MTSEAGSGSMAPSGSKFVNKEVKAVVAKGEADIKAAQKKLASELRKFKGKFVKTNGGRKQNLIHGVTLRSNGQIGFKLGSPKDGMPKAGMAGGMEYGIEDIS